MMSFAHTSGPQRKPHLETNRKPIAVAALLTMILWLISAAGVPASALAVGGATLGLTPLQMDPGTTQQITLTVQNVPAPGLAGFDISLSFNPGVVSVELAPGGDLGRPTASAGSGMLQFVAAQARGKTGELTLAHLSVKAIGKAGESSPIYLRAQLVGEDLKEIPATIEPGMVTIRGGAASVPGGGPPPASGGAPGGTPSTGGGAAGGGAGGVIPPANIPGTVHTLPVIAEHFAGTDRFDTAKLIAQEAYPGPNQETVLVANAYAPADALAGAPLAFKNHAPLILAPTASGEAGALKEYIQAACSTKGHVLLLGGAGVLDTSYQSGLSLPADRIGGTTREETAVQIAKQLIGAAKGVPVVVVNNNGFADAISIAPIAAQMGWPILLTDGGSLSKATAQFLAEEQPGQILVIGGAGVVSEPVYRALGDYSRSLDRIAGEDRFSTNAEVLKRFAGQTTKVAFANGDGEYPIDALAGASLGIPIVLVHDKAEINNAQKDYLSSLGQVSGRTFGGAGVIKQDLSW